MTEIRRGKPIEDNTADRWGKSMNELANGCDGCIIAGCVIPTIIIAILLFIALFGKDLGL